MKTNRGNALRFVLRRPYKIALCALLNAVLLVFCFVEGGQWLLAGSAIEEARESRVFLGTLAPHMEGRAEDGENPEAVFYVADPDQGFVSEEAASLLEASQYVRGTHTVVAHSARLSSKVWMPSDQAQDMNMVYMFVGTVRGEPLEKNAVVHLLDQVSEKKVYHWRIIPHLVAAGNPKHVTIPPTEESGIPILVISDEMKFSYDPETQTESMELVPPPDYGLADGKRALFIVTGSGNISLHSLLDENGEMIWPVYFGDPGDDALSDEDFAAKMIRENGLEKIAAAMDNAVYLVSVQEIDSADTLPLVQKSAMRMVTGRELTADDIGKNVCMMYVSDAADQGLRVGKTVKLALSDQSYSGWGGTHRSGAPTVDQTAILDYGPEEEFEIVGLYTYTQPNTGSDDYYSAADYIRRYGYPRGTIFIPTSERAHDKTPVSIYDYSFTVHKDDYDAFMRESGDALKELGYDVVMIMPNYIDIDKQLEELEAGSASNLVVGFIGLAVGLAVSVALPVLFWRKDYAIERRMGAGGREARGVYRGAWFYMAVFSAVLCAISLGVLSLVSETLFPQVLRSPFAVGIMSLFAAAELLVLAFGIWLVSMIRDRRQFAK